MSNAPLTLQEGISISDQARFNTAATLAGDVRMTLTAGQTALTAADVVSLTAAKVTVPSAEFSAARADLAAALNVQGAATLTTAVASGSVTAAKVVTNLVESTAPATDTLVLRSKKITLDGDLQVTGKINKVNETELTVQDKVITLGAVDPGEDGTVDPDDTTRSGCGLVVAGAPAYLPAGKDAALYEHSLRWVANSGDFTSAGAATAPHLRPAWQVSGGSFGIAAPDATGRRARFFLAPYFTDTVASLGLYYALDDGRVKLVHTFSTSVFAAP